MTPPNDLAAERAALGSILIEAAQGASRLRSVGHIITTPEMFYSEVHRKIWQAMLDIGEGVDSRTLSSKLKEKKQLDEIGGEIYLLKDLSGSVATAAHIEHYARIVARLYFERQIINEARKIATDPELSRIEPLRDLVLSREQMLINAPSQDIGTVLGDMVAHLDDKAANKKIMTGYECWDDIWYGCLPGEINTWGAATNEGKSVLLLNLMLCAAGAGHKCLIFGTEMSAGELSQRMIAIYSGLSARLIRRGWGPSSNERERYLDACDALTKLPIVVIDDPEPSLADIEVAISTHGTEVLFLDYLERFSMPREENLRLRIREFMRSLKSMARRRGVVVHLAAQLNRMSYSQEDMRPRMAMLSESSAVEKESDRVMLLWAPKAKNECGSAITHIEITTAKNRHGAKGGIASMSLSNISLSITEDKERQREFVEEKRADLT